eukprot:CAMPEP_0173116594 /NCGR_PEP_ID=MMETSP1102-20130122/49517_1 /TAXON_ID=49646 /ORGANISM="Geminigera sp., Strain Caron Lab Isolate" /LENGTH=154 /DNA_ID=CAMNT_0014020507 /DNA_START=35 /DNA_END=496 /DNA_ORIENTATION=-
MPLLELPVGWEERTSNSTGRTYYYNRFTGQSTWEIPSLDPHHQHSAPQYAPASPLYVDAQPLHSSRNLSMYDDNYYNARHSMSAGAAYGNSSDYAMYANTSNAHNTSNGSHFKDSFLSPRRPLTYGGGGGSVVGRVEAITSGVVGRGGAGGGRG